MLGVIISKKSNDESFWNNAEECWLVGMQEAKYKEGLPYVQL